MAGRSSRSSREGRIERTFFEPRSVAVVGASSHSEKIGHAVLSNLMESGYPGRIFPVNPHADEILDIPCYSDLESVDGDVDLALIIVPARYVPDVVASCASKEIEAAIIISAGFREIGVEGMRLENRVVRLARKGKTRLLGPNCLGVINTALPMNATFTRLVPPPGSVGVLSQSGAMCAFLLDWARGERIGFSKLVSLGNNADLNESDFLRALARDEQTNLISIYLEGVSDDRFLSSVRYASRRKPVVVFKAGTTQSGARAASSHTGSLAGSENAFIAVCEQGYALRASTVSEFLELSRSFATQNTPMSQNLLIVTNAGGPGIIAADACERTGMKLSPLSLEVERKLDGLLPPEASLNNPVDILGDADPDRYESTIREVLADPHCDALLIILAPTAVAEPEAVADGIVALTRDTDKTVLCCFLGLGSVERAIERLQDAGIPNVAFPDTGVEVISRMYERRLQTMAKRHEPVKFDVDSPKVDEVFGPYFEKEQNQVGPRDCRRVLEAYGIPCARLRVARDMKQAKEIARELDYPVALKVVSPEILHKTDIGGVELGIEGPEELEDAYDRIMYKVHRHMPFAEITGMAVQEMAPTGRELIIGMAEDPQFGPLLMVGFGGIYVEAFKDVSFRVAPINRDDARQMLEELKAYSILQGFRGRPPADVESVREVLLRVSQIAAEHREISEMDINPLMVYNAGRGCCCVDVRMTIKGG